MVVEGLRRWEKWKKGLQEEDWEGERRKAGYVGRRRSGRTG